MKLTNERIEGHLIDIYVDQIGEFAAEFNDQRYTAVTRLDLLEKLKKAVKLAAGQGMVDVTVLGIVPRKKGERNTWGNDNEPYEEGVGVVHAKLRSKHARQSGTWLLVSEDKQKFQVSGSRTGTIARRITDAEAAEYLRLANAAASAEAALETFVDDVSLRPDEALEQARSAKAS